MKVTVIGAGKVGYAIIEQLSGEGHEVTVIDNNAEALRNASNILDVMCVEGNAASMEIQIQAGVPKADFLIAVSPYDELNILCCLLGRKLGAKSTAARVRNPEYAEQLSFLREDLGLSLTINPELAAAKEISRLMRLPSAIKVDSFAKGRVELIECKINPDSLLAGERLADVYSKHQIRLLVCAVLRNGEIFIPSGEFVINGGDKIFMTASQRDVDSFFRIMGTPHKRIRNVMIIGGGRIAYYLSKQLNAAGMHTKIIERNRERCHKLSSLLPESTIICGDGIDKELLEEENIANADAFVALTDLDEVNMIIAMYAGKRGVKKVIAKVTRLSFNEVVESSGIETTISPKEITANQIVQFVRAKQNSLHSNVETLYKLVGGRLEALEFRVNDTDKPFLGVPLRQLKTKSDVLIACIYRNKQVIIPGGNDKIMTGDSVVVVTAGHQLQDLSDIMAE